MRKVLWKKLLSTLLVSCALALPVGAASVKTVVGTMEVPERVGIHALSSSHLVQFVLVSMPEPSSQDKGIENPQGLKIGEPLLGKEVDYYQVQYNSPKAIMTGELMASRLNPQILSQMPIQGLADVNAPMTQVTLALLNEQWMNVEEKIADSIRKKYKVPPNGEAPIIIRLDEEPITLLTGAKIPTYVAGSRAIIDVNGFEHMLYAKAFFQIRGEEANVLLFITSDAEREHLTPIVDNMVRSIAP